VSQRSGRSGSYGKESRRDGKKIRPVQTRFPSVSRQTGAQGLLIAAADRKVTEPSPGETARK
jgi:hypothetical protein